MADQATNRKRRGRPPKPLGGKARGNLTIRLRDRVREDLEAAINESGRSLSEEIEYRLELSLLNETTSALGKIVQDLEINWARFGERFTLLELQEDIIKSLLAGDVDEATKLAKVFVLTRAYNSGRSP